ncbi:UNVERIFIED_ORG: sulfotransferase [Bacillus sp. AZ43]
MTGVRGALPNLVIVGAMKCGTTTLHSALDLHPQVSMSQPKELNFFVGTDDAGSSWAAGTWHRGADWYAAQFDPAAPVRGEASPGYTSPAHPEAAGRMAALIPGASLVYAVRDPVERAVSQYWHHRREGSETRPPEEALLDPGSQYVARGRYLERLTPFLTTGVFEGRIHVVAQEDLREDPRATLRGLFAFLGVDDTCWTGEMAGRRNSAPERPPAPAPAVRDRLRDELRDDAERLRAWAGRDFPGWSV